MKTNKNKIYNNKKEFFMQIQYICTKSIILLLIINIILLLIEFFFLYNTNYL